MAIRRIPMSLNLVVRQHLWASVPYIDVQTGVKQIWASASNFGSQDARMPTYFIHWRHTKMDHFHVFFISSRQRQRVREREEWQRSRGNGC